MRSWLRQQKRWGLIVLGVWLIVVGALGLVPGLQFSGSGTVTAVLAVAAGVLILLER